MKKTTTVLFYVLFVLVALLPVGTVLSAGLGYTITLFNVSAFVITLAALSVCVVVLDFILKDSIINNGICVLMAIITPLSLINSVFCVFKCGQIVVLIGSVICIVCCFILTAKNGQPMALKIVALALSALMVLPVGFLNLVGTFFIIGQNTVVRTVESPSGKYYAEVVDSDQGALGGDTLVEVYEKSGINLLLFKIEKKPQRVYWGEWGDFKDMTIYWRDDRCIVINSVEHKIK